MDERHFNYYNQIYPLQNQQILHSLLEKKGFEIPGKCILTSPDFGVPITSMLLLMCEAANNLAQFQSNLVNLNSSFLQIDSQAVSNTLKLSGNNPFNKWEHKTKYEVDNSVYTSGSCIINTVQLYIPQQFDGKYNLLNYFTSSDDKVTVRRDHIIQRLPINEGSSNSNINLIVPYKNLITYLEISYSLSERVRKQEIKRFKELLNADSLVFPVPGGVFQKSMSLRGAYTHETSMKFSVNSENYLMVNDRKVTDLTTTGIKDACSWINSVYSIMIEKISN